MSRHIPIEDNRTRSADDVAFIENILTRICESFSRGMERSGYRLENRRDYEVCRPVIFLPPGEKKRLIEEALIADPAAKPGDIADMVGTRLDYVYIIRTRLREEGKLCPSRRAQNKPKEAKTA